MSKRSSSDIDIGSATDGPSDTPSSDRSPHSDEEIKPSKKAKQASSTGAVREYNQRQPWSTEEEAVFLELMERVCMTSLWNEVKLDERLAHRGSPGVRAHIIAMFKRLRK